MVNEPRIIVKNDFFSEDLQSLYDTMREHVKRHRDILYMACCVAATKIYYILYGTYTRTVIDARVKGYHNGIPELETIVIENFRVQRILHKDCGHTHALMFEWFIPYQQYSFRFVLLHLFRYFKTDTTIEAYCLDNTIPIQTFRRWLGWLKENMGLLTEMGLVQDAKENKENIREWICRIKENMEHWLLKSLAGLNLALFQRHKMPANYVNYRIGLFRKI